MNIPVSEDLIDEHDNPTIALWLSPEQAAWVERRAQSLDVSPAQFVRYVLNRWMRAERAATEQEKTAAGGGSSSRSPAASDAASDAADDTDDDPTVLDILRRGLETAERLRTQPEEPRSIPQPESTSQARTEHENTNENGDRNPLDPKDAQNDTSFFTIAREAS